MVLNAAVAAFYYLRVIVYMYMREPAADARAAPPRARCCGWGLAVSTVLTIGLGLFPTTILPIIRDAAAAVALGH